MPRRNGSHKLARLVAAALLAGSLAPAAARADLTWQPPQPPLSPTGTNVSRVNVAVGADGTAAASWTARPGSGSFTAAAVGAPRQYLQAATTLDFNADYPTPAVDPLGTAVVAWDASPNGSGSLPRASLKPAGAAFGAPQSLGQPLQTNGFSQPLPRVAPDGRMAVVWPGLAASGPQGTAIYRNLRSPGGAFAGPTAITALNPYGSDQRDQQDLAFGPDGSALLVWRWNPGAYSGNANDHDYVYAAYKPAGTDTFQAEVQVPGSERGIRPQVAWAGNGEYAIVFHRGANLMGVVRKAAGTWAGSGSSTSASFLQTATPASQPGLSGAEAQVASNADGLVAVSFIDAGFGPRLVVKRPGEWFGPGESPRGGSGGLNGASSSWADVAVDAAGDVLAVWRQTYQGRDEIRAGWRPAGGSFPPTTGLGTLISDPANDADKPRVGMDTAGNAVVAWETFVDGYYRAQATFGTQPLPPGEPTPDPPAPPPPTPPEPSPAPPPPPGVAAVTGIKVEGSLQRNAPVVLSATTSGPVRALEWSTTTSSRTITARVSSGGLPRGFRFRTDDDRFEVSVKAIGNGASAQPFSKAFALPRDKGERALVRARHAGGSPYARLLEGLDPAAVKTLRAKGLAKGGAFAVGPVGNLTGASRDCSIPTTVGTGGSALTGCLAAVPGVDDLPRAERGVLSTLRSGLGIKSADAKLTEAAMALSDGFSTTRPLDLPGGFPLEPVGGASLVSLAGTLASSNAGVRIGGDLIRRSGFQLKASDLTKPLDLGSVPKLPSLPKLGGFDIGDFDVRLVDGQAVISGTLKLPSILQVGGVRVQTSFVLRATPTRFILEDLTVGPIAANLAGIGIEGLQVRYTRASDTWEGQGKACLPGGACLSMIPNDGFVRFVGGDLDYAGALLRFPGTGIPLFPGVDMTYLKFGLGLDPTRITAGTQLKVAQVIGLNGGLVAAFPSAARPYRLNPAEVGTGFPASLYQQSFTRTTLGVSADVVLALPIVGDTKLGGGYFLYEFPGYAAFGGGFDFDLGSIVYIKGGISGEVDAVLGYFNLHGDVEGCVDLKLKFCAGAVAHVGRGAGNSGGAGACVSALGVSIGGGVLWRNTKPLIWPFDGCKWSRYRVVVRQSQAGAPMTLRAGEAFQLDGAGAAPTLKVTAPDGTVTQSTPESGLTLSDDKKVRILRYEQDGETFAVVGVQAPATGTYKVEPAEGSVPITGQQRTEDPPDAKIRASVKGRGETRTLRYDIGARPEQAVTFLEETPGGAARVLGRVARSGKGKLSFKPAPGRGRHTITAQFELSGIPAETRTVARFTPPSPQLRAPGLVKARRTKRGIVVRWLPVQDAARYEVVATIKGGGQRVVRTPKRTATIRLARTAKGTVSVRGVAPLREGRTAQRRFGASARKRSALRRLPKCKTGKRRITCR